MKPKNDRTQPNKVGPRKAFRIERLEERIAPKKGGNSKNGTANCNNDSGGGSGY